MTANPSILRLCRPGRALAAGLLGLTTVLAAQAGPDGRQGDRPPGAEARPRERPPGADWRPRERPPGADARHGERPPVPPPRGQWWDGAHGHRHYYPAPGHSVRVPPPGGHVVWWSGARYTFRDGIWYAPGPRGHVVVRPPYGVAVPVLPLFRTVVVIGGLTYLYANGIYYREVVGGGYEVVPPPVGSGGDPQPVPQTPGKLFVYPRLGQSAEQQASDEYECHRWAVSQSGFDPTASATGGTGPSADPDRRGDYGRARSACLDGRGYTVR